MRVLEVAALFARLGCTAFGGPAAHVALIEDEVVVRRRWLTREALLDYVSAANLIPGPNSTELVMHVGLARAGWPGWLAAGLAFILPAALLTGVLAWIYKTYGSLPAATGLLAGVTPVVTAVVAQALWRLGRTALASPARVAVGVLAFGAAVAGIHELWILGAAAVAMWAIRNPRTASPAAVIAAGWQMFRPRVLAAAAVAGGMAVTPVNLWSIGLIFLKIGSVLFGSGYVLLAFLRADLVTRLGWITERQLLDATAAGLITPGPVFTTATFIGYLLADVPGAVVATVAIFLPAFVFVALSGPIVPRLRRSPMAAAALDGVNVASLALMAAVSWHLGRAAVVDTRSAVICVVSLMALVRFRVNAAWLVAGGGIVGWLMVR